MAKNRKMGAQRHLELGFVKIEKTKAPQTNKKYQIENANSDYVDSIPYPTTKTFKKLDITINTLYIEDLPDFNSKNEGLFKITVDTFIKQEKDIIPKKEDISFVTQFTVKDKNQAASFMSTGAFENILFRDGVNLKLDLFELDAEDSVHYEKFNSVIKDIPEFSHLDVLRGFPYINLATKLFENIINVFGKNQNDHIWGTLPTLKLKPTVGGAFLRQGIYVIYESKNKKGQPISASNIEYIDNSIRLRTGAAQESMSNYLIFGTSIDAYDPNDDFFGYNFNL